jgi:uncharacterized membrane protein HdeD (DUF308 family)
MKLRYLNVDTMRREWFVFLLRGFLTILFSIIISFQSKLKIEILIILYGAYILIDGFVVFTVGLMREKLIFIIFGFVASLMSVYVFSIENKNSFLFLAQLSAWFLLRVVFEFSAALAHKNKKFDRWILLFSGGLSAIFCLLSLVLRPSFLSDIVWIFNAYLFIMGMVWIFYGLNIRTTEQKILLTSDLDYQSKKLIKTTLI